MDLLHHASMLLGFLHAAVLELKAMTHTEASALFAVRASSSLPARRRQAWAALQLLLQRARRMVLGQALTSLKGRSRTLWSSLCVAPAAVEGARLQ